MLNFRTAKQGDLQLLVTHDKHISPKEFLTIIKLERVLIAEKDGTFIGWLRYNLFWDNTPFLNMLYFLDEYRRKGYGEQFMQFWESEMQNQGYDVLMTSSASNENAQHFFQKLNYHVAGGFIPKDEPFEMIFIKYL